MENERSKTRGFIKIVLLLASLGWCVFMAGRIVCRIQSDGRFISMEKSVSQITKVEKTIMSDEISVEMDETGEMKVPEEALRIDRGQLIREIQNYEKQIPLAENAVVVNADNLKRYEEAFQNYQESVENGALKEEMAYKFYASSSAYVLMLKEDMLSSLGYTIEGNYEQQSEMDNFTQSLEENVINEISSQIADGVTAQIISSGVSDAVDSIKNSDSVSEIIENTWEGMQEGFAAGIQEAPKEFINAMFGVDLFGILEFFDTVNNMDEVPDYLVILLKRDISNYGQKLKGFLADEYVTSEELSKAVYWYKQYWDAVAVLNQLSGQTLIDDHWVTYSMSDIDLDYSMFKREEYVYRILVGE